MSSGRIVPTPVPPVTVSVPVSHTQIRLTKRRGTLIRNTCDPGVAPPPGAGDGDATVPAERSPARMIGAPMGSGPRNDFADGRDALHQEHPDHDEQEDHADLLHVEAAELERHRSCTSRREVVRVRPRRATGTGVWGPCTA